MFDKLIEMFRSKYNLEEQLKQEGGGWSLSTNDGLQIQIFPLNMGYKLISFLVPWSKKMEEEEFLLHAMDANFLYQGTAGAVLGYDGESLVLTLEQPNDRDFSSFDAEVEMFLNACDYWRQQ